MARLRELPSSEELPGNGLLSETVELQQWSKQLETMDVRPTFINQTISIGEYMTGGLVIILKGIGRNFAAGIDEHFHLWVYPVLSKYELNYEHILFPPTNQAAV